VTSKLLALACLGSLLLAAPAQATSLQPFTLAQFGPDENTAREFAFLKQKLEAYEALLSLPGTAWDTREAGLEVVKYADPEGTTGSAARSHPDWRSIEARVQQAVTLITHVEASAEKYHPALGMLSAEEAKLYGAIEQKVELNTDSPKRLLAGFKQLDELEAKAAPAVKAMVAKFRRTQAVGKRNHALPGFLKELADAHNTLAKAAPDDVGDQAQDLVEAAETLVALGVAPGTKVVLSDDPLSPEEGTLISILAAARGRAAEQADRTKARDKAWQARRAQEQRELAEAERAFDAKYTKGKPKAAALIAEHGYPTRVLTGPNGTQLWHYQYRANGLDRVKVLTVSAKDGSLVDINHRLE
jgi:hypothetical protein